MQLQLTYSSGMIDYSCTNVVQGRDRAIAVLVEQRERLLELGNLLLSQLVSHRESMSLKEPATKLALEPIETRPRRGNEGPKALPSLRKSQDHSRN